jgi:hypothetical protein
VSQPLPNAEGLESSKEEADVFSRKIPVEDDLYNKLKKCSESAGYATPEEFATHVLEKEVERIIGGAGGGGTETDEEIIKKRLQGLGYID